MNKAEYLSALSGSLRGLDERTRSEILLEMDGHIDGLAERHPDKSPEEIIAELDPPSSLAEALLREAGVGGGEGPVDGNGERPGGGSGARESRTHGGRPGQGAQNRTDGGGAPGTPGTHGGPGTAGTGGAAGGTGEGRRGFFADDGDLAGTIRSALRIARMFSGRGIHRDGGGRESMRRTFPGHGIRAVRVRLSAADAEIIPGGPDLVLEAEGVSSEEQLDVRLRGDVLEIREDPGEASPDEVRLLLPPGVDSVEVTTASGDVSILSFDGEVALRSASGDLEVRDCSGGITAATMSGDIDILGLRDVLRAETASGSVRVESRDADSGGKVSTVSGDIEIEVPEDADLSIRTVTVSGDVSVDGRSAGRGEFRLGGGSGSLILQTVSGDIEVTLA